VDDLRSDLRSSFASDEEIESLCLRNLLASAEAKIFFKDRESRFLLVSAGFLAVLEQGASLDELVGRTDFDIFSRPHAVRAFEDERRVIETGEAMLAKVQRETFDDRPDVWVSTTKMPLRDERGNTVGTWGIARDVTERTLVEVERARLAAIVDCSQDAIIGKDRDAVITVWNPGAERLYGYAASEAIGQPISLLLPPALRGEDREILRRVLTGEQIEHYQTDRVCKDGSVVNVSLSVSPILDIDRQVIGASSITRDVTAAVRAQHEIALQAELLDQVDAAVIATDTASVVQYWSRGAEQLYGYTAEEAIGHEVIDLIVPGESQAEMMNLGGSALAGRPAESESGPRRGS
jgi:PAS domain S-box-containing protein